jgi:hypothetical protein
LGDADRIVSTGFPQVRFDTSGRAE